ncbi:hypothetical protein CC86DRAFT_202354 [Ophiobolus disseminans]|uniref:Uncharacterized protein n=1 Tax=Ophiobolus disseminans TaxID=1469910 RepID=A0A6A7A5L4_9PLEO|nr:hypothetical protein CC86DRAFT_202354 [Ophiobolus disseminans]
MADRQSTSPEPSRPFDTDPTRADVAPSLTRRSTHSSDSSGPYERIPEGRWIVPFHGNCPRCHHHHNAAEMKIRVTQNTSRVSRIDCEKCNEGWIAIGGRNATMISLASVTSTEPDSIEEGVRFSLIDVVRMATERARSPLGTLPEQPPSRQASISSPASASSHSPHRTPVPSTVAPYTTPLSSTGFRQYPEPISPLQLEHAFVGKSSSGPRRILSKLKKKITSRFTELRRDNLKQIIGFTRRPKMSSRQFEKSPVRTPPAGDQHINNTVEQTPVPIRAIDSIASEVDRDRPSQRLAEVVAFIAGLDKTVLESKSPQEQIDWMREVYTDFKRNRTNRAPVTIAAVVHAGVQCDLSRPFDRRSAELFGAGTHIFGLENIDSPQRTISISEVDSESQTAHEENTPASFLRQSRQQFLQRVRRGPGSQRPQSLPGPPRLPPLLHPNFRNSFHALRHSRLGSTGSTSSLRGQAPPRWSQTSLTLHGSTQDPRESSSEETLRPVNDAGNYTPDDSEGSPPPPPSSAPRDDTGSS